MGPVSNEAVTAILASRGRFADAIRSYEIVTRRNGDPKIVINAMHPYAAPPCLDLPSLLRRLIGGQSEAFENGDRLQTKPYIYLGSRLRRQLEIGGTRLPWKRILCFSLR